MVDEILDGKEPEIPIHFEYWDLSVIFLNWKSEMRTMYQKYADLGTENSHFLLELGTFYAWYQFQDLNLENLNHN